MQSIIARLYYEVRLLEYRAANRIGMNRKLPAALIFGWLFLSIHRLSMGWFMGPVAGFMALDETVVPWEQLERFRTLGRLGLALLLGAFAYSLGTEGMVGYLYGVFFCWLWDRVILRPLVRPVPPPTEDQLGAPA